MQNGTRANPRKRQDGGGEVITNMMGIGLNSQEEEGSRVRMKMVVPRTKVELGRQVVKTEPSRTHLCLKPSLCEKFLKATEIQTGHVDICPAMAAFTNELKQTCPNQAQKPRSLLQNGSMALSLT